jgi:hypothetical protein
MTDPLNILRSLDPDRQPGAAFVRCLRERLLAAASDPAQLPDHVDTAESHEPSVLEIVEMDTLIEMGPRHRSARLIGIALFAAVTVLILAVQLGSTTLRTSDTTGRPAPPTSGSASPETVGVSPVPSTPIPTTISTQTAAMPPLNLPPLQNLEAAGARVFEVERRPHFAALDADHIWIEHQAGPMSRLDASTGEKVGSPAVNTDSQAGAKPVQAFGSMWVPTTRPSPSSDGSVTSHWNVARLHLASGEVEAMIDVPGEVPGVSLVLPDLAVAEDGIWMLGLETDRVLLRIDPSTNKITARWVVGPSAVSIAYAYGSLWVTRDNPSVISRINPADGSEVARIAMPVNNPSLSVERVLGGGGAVWAHAFEMDRQIVIRIDPASNAVVARIEVAGVVQYYGFDIAFGGGYLWTTNSEALLVKIDPATNTVVSRYGPEHANGGLAVDDSAVWVTDYYGAKVYRLPLR